MSIPGLTAEEELRLECLRIVGIDRVQEAYDFVNAGRASPPDVRRPNAPPRTPIVTRIDSDFYTRSEVDELLRLFRIEICRTGPGVADRHNRGSM